MEMLTTIISQTSDPDKMVGPEVLGLISDMISVICHTATYKTYMHQSIILLMIMFHL